MLNRSKLAKLLNVDILAFSVEPDNENEGVIIGKLHDRNELVVGYVTDQTLENGEWYIGSYYRMWDGAWKEFSRRVNHD